LKNNISISNILLLDTELAISWNDNTETYLELKLLRDNCPCAFCSGEKDVFGNVYKGPKKIIKEIGYKAIKMERIGHYAIRILWGDNHSDGLYTYDMLRKLN
tara:strand:- start:857 stop:1162 length:306 start_codon:yes stop_codon:yes gene_type:complete